MRNAQIKGKGRKCLSSGDSNDNIKEATRSFIKRIDRNLVHQPLKLSRASASIHTEAVLGPHTEIIEICYFLHVSQMQAPYSHPH